MSAAVPMAERAVVALHDFPAAGKLLAWFAWISLASPSTSVTGLALMGVGFFSKSDDSADGVVSGPGFRLSGTVRHLMIGAGFLIYFVGGAVNAGPPREPAPANYSTSVPFNLSS
jgi:hypothetical protein